ncbi:hypothetical protein AVEN_261442-1 [Araneus ventricosus]|uniref:Uncharacterized protein n=1 Tax=Araneus ventricosus TaxID=182803 RepID=A0A4Y2NHJ7_ARAVE|nr:hypothetical protein AVEN_261442-1 [Araneus ventricosus]
MPQEKIRFSNCNKGRLIAILSVKPESEDFVVKQVMEEADHLIVTREIAAAEHKYCIVDGGQGLLVELYVGKDDDTFNGLKFQLFTKWLVKANFNLASLPKTLEAVRQHSFTAYLLFQMWLGQVMSPLKWGWQTTKHGLAPITTMKI